MIALLYLPVLAAMHFGAGAALGGMAVLSTKALADLVRDNKDHPSKDLV